jgi:hypothetical protein
VAPCRCAEAASVIIRISQPGEAVVRHFVPFFARYLASFAANANSRISEKADFDVFLHVIVPPLVRALNSFADHRNPPINSILVATHGVLPSLP